MGYGRVVPFHTFLVLKLLQGLACFILTDKEGHNFSVFWVLVSVLLGAIAMLCKEQGITVLVRILLLTEF